MEQIKDSLNQPKPCFSCGEVDGFYITKDYPIVEVYNSDGVLVGSTTGDRFGGVVRCSSCGVAMGSQRAQRS